MSGGTLADAQAKAFALIQRGATVFPIRIEPRADGSLAKWPLTPHGHLDASGDSGDVALWAYDYPTANAVGVPTGANGIAVVDIDRHFGAPDGFASLIEAGVELPPTFHYETAGGGEHHVYAAPAGIPLTSGEILPGVDVKAGSSWVAWHGDAPEAWEFAPAPEMALKRRRAEDPAPTADVAAWVADNPGAPDGDLARRLAKLPPHGDRAWNNERLVSLAMPLVDAARLSHGGAAAREAFVAAYASGQWDDAEHRQAAARAFARAIAIAGGRCEADLPFTPGEPLLVPLGDAASPPPRAFRVLTRADLKALPRPSWLVEGLIQESGIVLLAGEGGLGKTVAALDIAARIATGTPWFGRSVKRGRVLYVAGEGVEWFDARVSAWEAHADIRVPDENLLYVSEGFSLANADAVATMKAEVTEREISLIVLDTFSQTSDIESENDNAEVARALRTARDIRQAHPGATVLILHHVSKANKGSARGAAAFRDNADAMIVARATGAGATFSLSTRTSDGGKMKNSREEHIDGFFLREVEPSVILDCENRAKPEREIIQGVLADGGSHAMAEFLEAAGSADEATAKRLRRELAKMDEAGVIVRDGSTKGSRYSLSDTVLGRIAA